MEKTTHNLFMGTTSTKSRKSKRTQKRSIPFFDDRKRKILGAICWFLAVYMAIAFVSYMYTWKVDQDKIFKFTWESLFQSDVQVANWLGRLGATLANTFFYWGFGLPSIIVVFLLVRLGRDLIQNRRLRPFWELVRNAIPLMAFTSLILEFLFRSSDFTYGGAFGESTYYWLNNFVGNIGLFFLLVFVGFSFIIWYFNPNLEKLEFVTDGMSIGNNPLSRFLPSINWGSKFMSKAESKSSTTNSTSSTKSRKDEKDDVDTAGLRPSADFEPSAFRDDQTESETTETLEFKVESNTKKTIKKPKVELGEMEINFNQPESKSADVAFDDVKSSEESASPTVSLKYEMEKENEDHQEPYDPTASLSRYKYPTVDLLKDYSDEKIQIDREELENNKDQIIQTLLNYKIEITKIRATVGPTVTLYEIIPAPGIKISKIKNLEDDIALSLAALGIRIIAPIPGKGTIGIEVPNKNKQIVSFKEVINSDKFRNAKMDLPIALGKTISNEIFVADLAKMPHLLIAGATGQGKSVGINTVIMSLLYKKHPSQMKLILIDPKKVELFPYGSIDKHYLACLPDEDQEPIICETSKVITTLNSLTVEMDERYDLLKRARARNLKEYNAKFVDRKLNPKDGHKFLPFIVLVIDEFADLIMTAGKEIELPIGRLAQLSRAVGIHLIIATQRPSVNIITGVIKANFPARLAFKVSSKVDSRTILDQGGADQLIGRGDMLLSTGNATTRIQCAFVDTPEVERILDHIHNQPGYGEPFYLPEAEIDENGTGAKRLSYSDLDSKFVEAARLIVSNQHGSTSSIQRSLQLGYNRAGRIMDQMESLGIVGPAKGSKPREVLFFSETELNHFINQLRDGKV